MLANIYTWVFQSLEVFFFLIQLVGCVYVSRDMMEVVVARDVE